MQSPWERTIRVKLHDGSEKLFSYVGYILELSRNLISLGMLKYDGLWFKFENGLLHVFDKSIFFMKGIKKNRLYV